MFPGEVSGEAARRVRIVRLGGGRVGDQDPDAVLAADGSVIRRAGAFIQREEAVGRLRYDFDRRRIVDSFGGVVGAGNVGIIRSGLSRVIADRSVTYRLSNVDPRTFQPRANEEVIESVTFLRRDGTLKRVNISSGLGQKYDKARGAGKWGASARDALGLKPGEKASYSELKSTVIHREFIVKRWR